MFYTKLINQKNLCFNIIFVAVYIPALLKVCKNTVLKITSFTVFKGI